MTNIFPHPANTGMDDAIRDMIVADGVIDDGGEGGLSSSAISGCVGISRTIAYDKTGRRHRERGLWQPLGSFGPALEEGMLLMAVDGLATFHYELHEPTVRGFQAMMQVKNALPPGTYLEVAMILTEIQPFGNPEQARYDAWFPTGPVSAAFRRGLLVRTLRDATLQHDRAVG